MTELNLLISAINFAAIAHRDQRRKNAAAHPYINHPIEVMTILSNVGVTNVYILAAAVLHDTVEDCGVTYDDLVQNFGKHIADMVLECTDDKSKPKVDRKKHQIEHAASISAGAKLAKCADKYSNCRALATDPPASWSKERIYGYFAWSYAVWLNARGVNLELDQKLADLFASQGLDQVPESDLKAHLVTYFDVLQS